MKASTEASAIASASGAVAVAGSLREVEGVDGPVDPLHDYQPPDAASHLGSKRYCPAIVLQVLQR